MRVLQLIDSLDAGGAERVAVNLANALTKKIEISFLCATRKEGLLKKSIEEKVSYIFLNKKHALDLKAFFKLYKFVLDNQVNIIHAHSSSFLWATLIKLFLPRIKIIWHDHYGRSEFLKERKFELLKLCSKYFSQGFAVNKRLKEWGKEKLKVSYIDVLPNFSVKDKIEARTTLFGEKGKRIVHLANLRPQKNHELLIDAFEKVLEKHPKWTLHCIGEDFFNEYSKKIKELILNKNLGSSVFFYGAKSDISNILKQSDIGVLSSSSEGLPLALLEYGMSKLPVVATRVGDCDTVVSNPKEGFLVPPNNSELFSNLIIKLIEDVNLREETAANLQRKIEKNFSKDKIIKKLLNTYRRVSL